VIASMSRGVGFRGLIAYVLDAKHDPTLVATNMGGRTVRDLAWEFRAGARQREAEGRTDVLKPVVHVSLSFAPDDRRLSEAELSIIAEQFLQRMGYEDSQYVAVEHRDRGHQHVHLVVSRVRLDGSLVREELGDFYKAMEVCRHIEREHGLRQVLAQDVSGLHQATKNEFRESMRRARPSERMQLQGLVAAVSAASPPSASSSSGWRSEESRSGCAAPTMVRSSASATSSTGSLPGNGARVIAHLAGAARGRRPVRPGTGS
jgi:relaxase-like protein